MYHQQKKEILLESGTNELEILELGMTDGQSFGINVAKVREIVAPMRITKIPRSHPYVSGLIQLRDEVLPVINLAKVLDYEELEVDQGSFIITEFNLLKVVFHVGWVNQIFRVSWEKIEKPSEVFRTKQNSLVGIIKLEEKVIQLLDFEEILVDINPHIGINKERVGKAGLKEGRKGPRIVVAEDSFLLRKLLEETLTASGYSNLIMFDNGKLAWEYLVEMEKHHAKDLSRYAQIVITDIEMPQMDGLHLTKRIKEHPGLKDLPVIIFSSLISDSLRHKGKTVGVDAQITKPQIDILVQTLDQYLL